MAWPEDLLPPVQKIRLISESCYYGATKVATQPLGSKCLTEGYPSWPHGWVGISPLRYPAQLSFSGGTNELLLVHTAEQREFMVRHGYSSVHAVGMPFCYARQLLSNVERHEGSLLVMPPHASSFSAPSYDEKSYVESIKNLGNHFREIVICVTGDCLRHNKWKHEFELAGFRVILGADIFDANALTRMATLFAAFETITTPSLGSHLVYASLSGCKISLWGPTLRHVRSEFIDEPYYQRFPEMLEYEFSEEVLKYRSELETRFRCHPSEASTHIIWSLEQSGYHLTVNPSRMANLLRMKKRAKVSRSLSRLFRPIALSIAQPLHYPRKLRNIIGGNR